MQDREKHKIDEIFRNGLADLTEEAPSVSGWNVIKKEIANEGLKLTAAAKYAKLLQLSIASAVLVTTGILTYLFIDKTSDKKQQALIETTSSASVKTEDNLTVNFNAKSESNASVNAIETADNTSNNNISPSNQLAAVETKNNSVSSSVERKNSKHINRKTTRISSQINETESENSLVETTDAVSTKSKSTARNVVRKSRNKKSIIPATKKAEGLLNNNNGVSNQNSDVTLSNNNLSQNGLTAATTESEQKTTTDKAEVKTELAVTKPELKNDEAATKNSTSVDSAASTSIPDSLNKTAETAAIITIDPNFKKFSVGVYVSLDQNYYSLQHSNSTMYGGANNFGDSIKGVSSWAQYTIGFTGGYKPSQNILIESGLFYSQKKKIEYNSPDYHTLASPNDSSIWVNNKCSYHNNAQYIQLFLKMKMYLLDKEKYRVFIAPGVLFDANVPASKNNSSYYQVESTSATKYTKQKYTFETGSIGTNLTLSTGVELKMKNDWIFSFEPSYIYGLNQLVRYKNVDAALPVKHYNRSIGLGLRLIKEF
jgi:Outer membrane protein beta-barrel domain